MINPTPSPIAFSSGPLAVHWYGIAYAVGLAAAYLVISREARWRGLDVGLLSNAMIVVAIAALIGGRLYHVIDQWQLYKDDLLRIVLPPYSGLGVFGGIIAGVVVAYAYARWKRRPFLAWADAGAPGLFVMQAIGRWGNFFNQELYGSPTNLPWGSPSSASTGPRATRVRRAPTHWRPSGQHFHPMFLYESLSLRGRVTEGRQLAPLRGPHRADHRRHQRPRCSGHSRRPPRSIVADRTTRGGR